MDKSRFHSRLSIKFAGSLSPESKSNTCIVHRGCGFFPREGSLARTFVQLRSLAPGFLSATTHLPLHISDTGSQAPVWWQLQLSSPVLVSPGRAMDVPTLFLLLAWHSPALQDPLPLLETGGHPRKTNPPPTTAGDSGKGCKSPRPNFQNDSHSLLEPVDSQSQRAFVLVNTRPERRGTPEGEEQLRRLLDPQIHSWRHRCPVFFPSCLTAYKAETEWEISKPVSFSTSARMGLRPPKVSKETRPLDFSKCGLWLLTPQPNALEDQSSGGYSCPGLGASPWDVPGPGATPCLTVIPAGPHLILLISLTLSKLAQPVAKDSPHLTFRARRSDGLPDSVSLSAGPHRSPRPAPHFTSCHGYLALRLESPAWCLRSALGTTLGTVHLQLVSLCLCLLPSSTSRPLST